MKPLKLGISSPSIVIPSDLATAKNSERLIQEHLKVTGGKIITRFPPEPNGYIHIGHAKSMYLNFKGAFEKAGKYIDSLFLLIRRPGECILRFDDTNPAAEKEEFIENIMEDVQWLGWKPCKINFASDNFDKVHLPSSCSSNSCTSMLFN